MLVFQFKLSVTFIKLVSVSYKLKRFGISQRKQLKPDNMVVKPGAFSEFRSRPSVGGSI